MRVDIHMRASNGLYNVLYRLYDVSLAKNKSYSITLESGNRSRSLKLNALLYLGIWC